MKIEKVILRRMDMTMKHPFTTSFGTIHQKDFLIATVQDELGNEGWGEGVAFAFPWYTEETTETSIHMIRDFLVPAILNKTIEHPDEVNDYFSPIRRNSMAKATIEGAVWDLYAKRHNMTLAEALGGTKERIEVGISIGIERSTEKLIAKITSFIEQGYKRIKVKIKPGQDIEVLRMIRAEFPDIPLMADANSAYTLNDIELLKELDQFNLMMIEQPLASDDIVDHAKLQKQIETPICLDESIHSLEDARKAIELGSCRIINIKTGRVGGLSEAKKIHDYCEEKGIAVWCGGMLESGIGRAQNIALTTLPNFTLPGDTAGSSRYWEEDIITPEVVAENGYISVPKKVGIGYEPNLKTINKFTGDYWVFPTE